MVVYFQNIAAPSIGDNPGATPAHFTHILLACQLGTCLSAKKQLYKWDIKGCNVC